MIRLLLSSGRGPAECRMALARALDQIENEARRAGLGFDCVPGDAPDRHGPASAIVRIDGDSAEAFAASWIGSAQWIARRPLRPNHKRKNWFIGVFRLEALAPPIALDERDVEFETLRAGGPGGQHQNTTDSAVRATHCLTGLSVVARGDRSQHRNRIVAMERLAAILAERAELARMQADKNAWTAHGKLQRGGAVRKL